MHVRASVISGTQVVSDATQYIVGTLGAPLIDSDTGKIVGFFVHSFEMGRELLLQSIDITSWGTRVHILSEDRLGPPEDFVRFEKLLTDGRTFLGQTIRVQGTGRSLGKLCDVQFSTRHFLVEWIFPRRFFFAQTPIAASEIVEVTPEAVWIKNPVRPIKEEKREEEEVAVPAVLPESAPAMSGK